MKEKAILALHVGELGWEILRFAPHVLYLKNRHPECKLIICTRQDRFDLYGNKAHILEPLLIDGDGDKYKGDCFRLSRFPEEQYQILCNKFKNKYSDEYDIIKTVFPKVDKINFQKKDQFNHNKMIYEFEPRPENYDLVNTWIHDDNPIVVIAPRYREKFARNWPYWKDLYELIYNDLALINTTTFVLCGKSPEYIPDPFNRFFDINGFPLDENTSLIGITIAILKRAILTVGSQSGIPNLSNLVGTPTFQWGHEQWQHQKTYNVKNTPTTFIKVGDNKSNYSALKAKTVYKEIKRLLKKEMMK